MNMITHEDAPRFYALRWKDNPPRIQILLHKDFIPLLRPYRQELIEDIKNNFSFNEFRWDIEESLGFENALKFLKKENSFFVYEAVFPKIYLPTGNCEYCKGSGHDKYRSKCLFCNGKKKEFKFLWEKAFAISWSLQLIFECFPLEEKSTASEKQLMTVGLTIEKDLHGGLLGGQYGVSLVRWLSENVGYIPKMVEAMKKTYHQMYEKNYFDAIDFRACVENSIGWLSVSCPGDACQLLPSYKGIQPGRGYDFVCHNIDSPIQQLTLLAGLAALYELADKDLSK